MLDFVVLLLACLFIVLVCGLLFTNFVWTLLLCAAVLLAAALTIALRLMLRVRQLEQQLKQLEEEKSN